MLNLVCYSIPHTLIEDKAATSRNMIVEKIPLFAELIIYLSSILQGPSRDNWKSGGYGTKRFSGVLLARRFLPTNVKFV